MPKQACLSKVVSCFLNLSVYALLFDAINIVLVLWGGGGGGGEVEHI